MAELEVLVFMPRPWGTQHMHKEDHGSQISQMALQKQNLKAEGQHAERLHDSLSHEHYQDIRDAVQLTIT
jgi:hypothetical protein